jgi:hypothetical protein
MDRDWSSDVCSSDLVLLIEIHKIWSPAYRSFVWKGWS